MHYMRKSIKRRKNKQPKTKTTEIELFLSFVNKFIIRERFTMKKIIGTLTYWKSVVCSTCLSSDRELSNPWEIQYVLHLIPTIQLNVNEDKICWECKSLLLKFWQFHQRALNAQQQLQTALQDQTIITSLSNLKTSQVDSDSFEAFPDTQNNKKSLIGYNNPGKVDSEHESVEDFIDFSKPLPIQPIFLKRISNIEQPSKKIKTGLSLDDILLKCKELNENNESIMICDMTHINIKTGGENNSVNLDNKAVVKIEKEIDEELSAKRSIGDIIDIIKTEYTDENSDVNILTDLTGKTTSKDRLIRIANEDGTGGENNSVNLENKAVVKIEKEIDEELSAIRSIEETIDTIKTECTDENSGVNILTKLTTGKTTSKDRFIRIANEDGVKKKN